MSTLDDSIKATQGPIKTAPTVSASASLGTTATAVRSATATDNANQIVRVRAVNLSSSNKIAVGFASGVKADETDANCGTIILPEQSLEFTYKATLDLYVVASAGSTSYQVSYEKVSL